jgi:hypothetical protein
MYIVINVKYPLFLSDFNETRIFPKYFRKTLKYQIQLKSVQWKPSCYIRTDRHDEANSRFRNFVNKPKNTKNAICDNPNILHQNVDVIKACKRWLMDKIEHEMDINELTFLNW